MSDCLKRLDSDVQNNIATVLSQSVLAVSTYMEQLNLCPSCQSYYMLAAVIQHARSRGARHEDIIRLLGGSFNALFEQDDVAILFVEEGNERQQ